MRYQMICVVLWSISLGWMSNAQGQVQVSPLVLTSTTKLTPFKIVKGKVIKQIPINRSSLIKANEFTALVVASWCYYSQQALRDIAQKRAPAPDLIIFADDEVTGAAQRRIRYSEMQVKRRNGKNGSASVGRQMIS
jgi:type IV secretory pathway VirB6-like protein